MNMSNYLENELVKHIFRTGSFTKPTELHVRLYTDVLTDAGVGTEVAGIGYAPVQRDPLDANWSATSGTDGLTGNVADIDFGVAGGDWGEIQSVGIWDAAAGGNLICWAELTDYKTVSNGDPCKFPAGDLQLTFA